MNWVRVKTVRRAKLRLSPAVVNHNNRAIYGKGPILRLPENWFRFFKGINTEKGFRLASSPNSGWVNEGWGAHDTPLVQAVVMSGNVLLAPDGRGKGGYTKVLTFKSSELPPEIMYYPLEILRAGHPYLMRFTCVDIFMRLWNPGKAAEAYYPLVTELGFAFIGNEFLEFFSEKPQPKFPANPVTRKVLYKAILLKGRWVRQSIEGNKVRNYDSDLEVEVYSESRGWVEIGDRRWTEAINIRRIGV